MRLESWKITAACRERGNDVAWEDAVSRLKEVYDAQLERFGPDWKGVLLIAIERDHTPEGEW